MGDELAIWVVYFFKINVVYENVSDCLKDIFHEAETFFWCIHGITAVSISAKVMHLLQVTLLLRIFVKVIK